MWIFYWKKSQRKNKLQKRPRRKRTKNDYFTKVHENAIIKYALSNCRQERTELYASYIQPAFSEMVNKIIFTYKFNTLPNIDPLREDCKIWLTTILDKYDPNKGSKAFSYFSVVTKNWFILDYNCSSPLKSVDCSVPRRGAISIFFFGFVPGTGIDSKSRMPTNDDTRMFLSDLV